jgi:signal transduction histidine kinase
MSKPEAGSPEPGAWYRSLYWRIGIGFVIFLAVVLAAQGLTLVWLISRMTVSPGPPPPEVARLVAREISDALAANPQLDIAQFLRQQYEQRTPLVVVMRDGRTITSDGSTPPGDMVSEARSRLERDPGFFLRGRGGGRGPWPGGEPERGRSADPGPGRGPGPGPGSREGFFANPSRRAPPGLIVVNGEVVGAVLANPPSTLRQLGPTLLIVGLVLVGLGTTSAAVLIFGPVRQRLRSLEDASRRVGAGDLTARAREDGGDEVAALAHAFNRMAGDLAARAAQLEASDRTRRLLLADVSHELMTPLTAMRGYLETLSMRAGVLDPDTRERYLGIVGDETRRVEHIVGDLLDLARVEGGGDSFDMEDVPLEDLFARIVARHGREAAAKNVALATSIAPGAEIVIGDPLRLEQALQNLAANALRHTPSGGRISLQAELDSREVVITVRDSGTGIPLEHLPHVFDRFYKADPSRSGQAVGSGLGLSIVKAVVERHGGTIQAASRPDEGTWFTIRLPHS